MEREGKLKTFRSLQSHGFGLVYDGLHPAAGNLIGLLLELRPERFTSLVERLDHPVIQARAAYHVTTAATPPLDFQGTLRWITEGSCDALVAPDQERADRQEVDALLERSNFFRR